MKSDETLPSSSTMTQGASARNNTALALLAKVLETPKPFVPKSSKGKASRRSFRKELKRLLGTCDWAMQSAQSEFKKKRYQTTKVALEATRFEQIGFDVVLSWYLVGRLNEVSVGRQIFNLPPATELVQLPGTSYAASKPE